MIRVALVGPYPLDTARVNGGLEASFVSLVEGLACTPDVEPHVITFVPGLDRPQRSTVGGVGVDYLPGDAGSPTLSGRFAARSCTPRHASLRVRVPEDRAARARGRLRARARAPFGEVFERTR
jgi:hypothetical protein